MQMNCAWPAPGTYVGTLACSNDLIVVLHPTQVYYGKSGGALSMSAVATVDTYMPSDMVGPIANSTGYIFPGTYFTCQDLVVRAHVPATVLYQTHPKQTSLC